MFVRRCLLALVSSALISGALAGCGGGGSSSGDSTSAGTLTSWLKPEQTKADWIRKADTICRQVDVSYKSIEEEIEASEDIDFAHPKTLEEVDSVLVADDQKAEQESIGLGQLKPPWSEKSAVASLLGQIERTAALALHATTPSEMLPPAEFRKRAAKEQGVALATERAARAYGLKVCGKTRRLNLDSPDR